MIGEMNELLSFKDKQHMDNYTLRSCQNANYLTFQIYKTSTKLCRVELFLISDVNDLG